MPPLNGHAVSADMLPAALLHGAQNFLAALGICSSALLLLTFCCCANSPLFPGQGPQAAV